MKFTLNWLKDYLETDASLDEIGDKLTALGLEVESITNPAALLEAFTVAQIESATQHPDADRLRVCQVNTGTQILQIVCGAPNARAGIKVALAQEGTIIPNGEFKIKKSKIRGVESNGMLCSSSELNLGDEDGGILELPESAMLGQPIAETLGINDAVFDIAITPNRGDCLGVYGIARDLAAAGMGRLKPLNIPSITGAAPITNVSLNDDGCTHFISAEIRNVTNGKSPQWMQQRLKAVGQRPISALVDITNYISIAFCRPLHVYDLDKLQGSIKVRTAHQGESFAALNDKTVSLQGTELVIADDSGVIGLAGIIGGTSTACDENTQNVLLEVAYFNPIRVAKAGRALAIESDARYRFERSVDPAFLAQGAAIAVEMITQQCGGNSSALASFGQAATAVKPITFNPQRINQLTGLNVSEADQKTLLTKLGFTFSNNITTPPSWRPDVKGIADLAEEIARLIGYENIPITPLSKPALPTQPRSDMQQRAVTAKQTLAQCGLQEVCHWSFMSSEIAPLFGGAHQALKLLNPISSELDQMRPNLLPHLISASKRNYDRGLIQTAFFEVGLQYHSTSPKGQTLMASGLFSRNQQSKTAHHPARNSDVFDAKAAIEAVINASGFDAARLQIDDSAPDWYHPGKSGSYRLGKNVIASFGEIHPVIAKKMDVEEGLIGFEIALESIPFSKQKTSTRPVLALSEFQSVSRDFAFVVPQNIPAAYIISAAQKADNNLIQNVDLFDVYQGKGLADTEKSLALRVTLQATDRTLTDKEIDAISDVIIANVRAVGAKLRA